VDAPIISAHELAASYSGRTIFEGATFDVVPGEFIAVLGPNGSGKSTLLRIILGLLRPARGRLDVLGGAPRRGDPRIGYVPQRRSFDIDVPVRGRDLVRLGVDGHRWGFEVPGPARREADRRVAESIQAVHAEAYAERRVGRLSGGEQQRLSLAQALVGRPQILLLDEPLASLDLRNQIDTAALIADLAREQGLTVILIAHDVNPLMNVIDRVLYVARGRTAIGKPQEMITTETLSRLYGAQVEVLRDSHGHLFVMGLEGEAAHPHGPDH
jgi:zinc/manganese transport system ATP-binding protein